MSSKVTTALLAPASAILLLLATGAAEVRADDPAPQETLDQAPPAAPDQEVIPPHIVARMAANAKAGGRKPGDLPKFDDVAKDYKKVVSTTDGAASMYTVWTRKKDSQVLAELPRNFESQKLFIAYTIAGGTPMSGVQTGDKYAYWKRFDKKLALIEPNYEVRTTGDLESRKGRNRVFTDRVILSVPIAAMGPGGGPVVDMDALLVGQATKFFGGSGRGANTSLAKISKAKAFPKNVELAFELPLASGRFGTFHYSFSVLPENTGYKPRAADARVGYFATSYRDIGHPGKDTPWVRYVNRWKLEKADPKLSMSPPKEPIVFYLEHTIPVRYRRWVREGLLEWNKAFEEVGIVGAIEVYQQDARTNAHMDKDPEDARYNFMLWTNASMGFAIGPSRVDPRTGQILDADIVMDEGFVTSWVKSWERLIPETAMLNFGPEALAWMQSRPQWDPRVRLAAPAERPQVLRQLQREAMVAGHPYAGHPAAAADATLLGDQTFDGLAGRISQVNGRCECANMLAQDLALFRMDPTLLTALGDDEDDESDDEDSDDEDSDDEDSDDEDSDDEDSDDEESDDEDDAKKGKPSSKAKEQMLDGVPESFIGPMLRDVIMHEVGHTLGLRHNFKASTIYSLEEINTEAMKGKAITGSVMDYNPININVKDGPVQGDYTMMTLGPYDYWAIEYGYSFERDLKPILARVSEPELIYGTDEDSWGSDPRARVFDLGANPLDYSDSQMRLVVELRKKLLDRMVKEGDSWAKARQGYELLLSKHVGAVSIAANWVGGTYSNRDRKGDPGDRDPVTPVSAEQQRRALQFVIDNTFDDEAFGLTPELLAKMSIDKWWDEGFAALFADPAWPVHERILGIRAAAMSMIINPTTLARVYDNEFRVSADEDALTVPEVMFTVHDAVWSELEKAPGRKYTARKPMISSLRRDLQREHLERLIDLTLPNQSFGVAAKPVANLSTFKLRELSEQIGELADGRSASRLDPYTLAHLSEAKMRIDKALDAQYIYNTNDIKGGGGMPMFLFGEDD